MLTGFAVRNVFGEMMLQAVDVDRAAEVVVATVKALVVVVVVGMFKGLLFHGSWYAQPVSTAFEVTEVE